MFKVIRLHTAKRSNRDIHYGMINSHATDPSHSKVTKLYDWTV